MVLIVISWHFTPIITNCSLTVLLALSGPEGLAGGHAGIWSGCRCQGSRQVLGGTSDNGSNGGLGSIGKDLAGVTRMCISKRCLLVTFERRLGRSSRLAGFVRSAFSASSGDGADIFSERGLVSDLVPTRLELTLRAEGARASTMTDLSVSENPIQPRFPALEMFL